MIFFVYRKKIVRPEEWAIFYRKKSSKGRNDFFLQKPAELRSEIFALRKNSHTSGIIFFCRKKIVRQEEWAYFYRKKELFL